MENVSKALLIAGAMILCIVIVAVGIYIFKDSNTTITDSMTSMSTQEIDAHNTKFLMYEAKQSGANIKSLVGILITNSNSNKEENARIPGVYIENENDSDDSGIPENGKNSSYIAALENIRNNVVLKHDYWVEMTYQDNGLIDYINIYYDKNNIDESMSR